MRIAGIVQESIVDGPGIRCTVFTQGCFHNCEGCHNPATHDVDGGTEKDVSAVIEEVLLNPLTDGVTLSGGEPFLQAADCSLIAKAAHENGLNVWTYSGYTFEELLKMGEKDDAVSSLLHETDILIDGRFELPLRSLALNWRGSKNQRVIDVKKSFEAGTVIEAEE